MHLINFYVLMSRNCLSKVLLLTHMKKMCLCDDQCHADLLATLNVQSVKHSMLWFLKHHNCDESQTLHWAFSVHTTFSDLDHTFRSQQCQINLSENVYVLIRSKYNFVWIFTTLTITWLPLFLNLHLYSREILNMFPNLTKKNSFFLFLFFLDTV